MSLLDKSASKAQLIDILNSMKFPIMGAGGGFAPIGTINFFDASIAPQGWLICDGSTHNIADYPELAAYFASHHGSTNYYGGDGVTTFAVPTRSGMPTSGVDTPDEHIVGEVRETVDGVLKKKPVYTKILSNLSWSFEWQNQYFAVYNISSATLSSLGVDNIDRFCGGMWSSSDYKDLWDMSASVGNGRVTFYCHNGTIMKEVLLKYTKTTDSWQPVQEGHSSDGNGIFCIKATVAGDPEGHVYSTDEQVVGQWIDGKPLYQKTLVLSLSDFINESVWYRYYIQGSNMLMVDFAHSFIETTAGTQYMALPYIDTGSGLMGFQFIKDGNGNGGFMFCGNRISSIANGYVFTVQYTKTS